MSYADFLAHKGIHADHPGPELNPDDLIDDLHEWQARIVLWAIKTRRAAIWADTGLGKTLMQLQWAYSSSEGRPVAERTLRRLVVAPLAVCQQTVNEAHRFGWTTTRYVRSDDEIGRDTGTFVTNYERVQAFDPSRLDAVVLDESSILKQSNGKTRTLLIDHFKEVPARLACSATPAPNDPEELTNQAEWLGRMQRNHMLAAYFVHDQDGWRLKGHAREPMIEWMSRWAVAIRRPSDIGGDDHGYDLPGLNVIPQIVEVEAPIPEGELFASEIGGVTGRAQVRRQYEAERTRRNGPPKRDGSVGVPERYRHGWLSLMEKIAEGNTLLLGDRLEGANCNLDNAYLFDTPDIGGDKEAKKAAKLKRQAAEQLCATCPARDACADWAATQPRSKHIPIGAFLPTPRPRKATAA